MKKYYIEKIGRGIEGGYFEDYGKVVSDLDKIVSERIAQGWYVIHTESEANTMIIVLARKVDGNMSIVGYQLKSIEV